MCCFSSWRSALAFVADLTLSQVTESSLERDNLFVAMICASMLGILQVKLRKGIDIYFNESIME